VKTLFLIFLGEFIATALLGYDMDDDRAIERGGLAKSLFHSGNIVAVEGADITHTQSLEERRWLDHFADGGIKALKARIGQAPDPRKVPDRRLDTAPG
jgi:hypothetical protein